MIDPTLTITVSRLLLPGPPAALVFSGKKGDVPLVITGYVPPSREARVTYAPDSVDVHGSVPIAAAWQQSIIGWDWAADGLTSESDVQAAYDEVAAALGQFTYTVTTQVSGAPAQAWKADMGSITPVPRTFANLANLNPEYAVTIPVYPIAGS